MATSTELATAIQTAQDATTAEVQAIDALVQVSQTLVSRVTDSADDWDANGSDLASYITSNNTAVAAKQDELSASNHKTINGQSLLGAGDLTIVLGATVVVTMEWANRDTLRATAGGVGDSVHVKNIGTMIWQAEAEFVDDGEICFVTTIASTITGQWVLRIPAYEFTEIHRLGEMNIRDTQLIAAGVTV
jgi:ferritin-like metal-binding protein YciE